MTDRTGDFLSMVAALPPPPPMDAKKMHIAPSVSTLSEFHGATSSIAKEIHVTSQKLSQLTKLVQSRGLFNDPAQEINELVHDIKQDIQGINTQLDQAQTYVDSRKTQMAGGAQGQHANHSINVVGQLKAELLNATKTFKDVLQVRSSKLKEQAERKNTFFNQPSAVTLGKPAVYKPLTMSPTLPPPPKGGAWSSPEGGRGPPNSGGGGLNGSRHGGVSLPRPGMVSAPPDDGDENGGPQEMVPLIPSQQQRLQQAQLIPEQGYLEARSTAMQEVESHILELGTVFNRLATMLQDQRELVESVHDNVEDAEANVNRGQLALLGTLRALQSNRMLVAKVSGILVLFVLLFIIFLA
ncbi:soluble NSF attachment protein receptor [Tribonema minus]|uniref:Soluble NSF attachment protein receptor n=1 Tax=Tribonema minus TaxID=303371 RepID=A0A835ZBM9_9STRA|nr:soluble NSF attachment protein receptor [Tribonema minus]